MKYLFLIVLLGLTFLGMTQNSVQIKKEANTSIFNTDSLVHPNPNKILKEAVIQVKSESHSKSLSPIPTEIFKREFFLKNPSNNIFESLQMLNGIQPVINCTVCNTGSFQINGMEGPYTLVLIDGMPIVSALSTVYGLSGIPNSMIERVEITKGPASAQFGSEAMGGTINIITRQIYAMPKFSVDFFSSTYGENNLDFGLAKKGEKWSYLTSGNLFYFQNKIDLNNDNFTDIPLMVKGSLFSKINWNRNNQLNSQIAARIYAENRFGGELKWTDEFRGGDSIYGESIYTKRFEILANHPFYLGSELVKFQFSLNGHFQDAAYGQNLFIAQQYTSFSQFTYNRNWAKKSKLFSGLSLKAGAYDDNSGATAINENNQLRVTPGFFIQNETRFNSKHTTLAGLRLDRDPLQGLITSPRIFHRFEIGSNQQIKLSAGNGFRVVNVFTEDHAALTGARKVVVENNLQPEKSYNLNLQYNSWHNLKNGYFNWDITCFYSRFTNKIIPNYLIDPNLIVYQNLNNQAISRGISFNIDADFEIPLDINFGCTFMDVFSIQSDSMGNKTKQAQMQAPRFTSTYQLSYQFKKIGMSIDFVGQIVGAMPMPILPNDFRASYSPLYALNHITFTKKWKTNWEAFLGVKNIANYLPQHPLMRWWDPFDKQIDDKLTNPNGYTFDTGYSYAPMQGRRLIIGARFLIK